MGAKKRRNKKKGPKYNSTLIKAPILEGQVATAPFPSGARQPHLERKIGQLESRSCFSLLSLCSGAEAQTYLPPSYRTLGVRLFPRASSILRRANWQDQVQKNAIRALLCFRRLSDLAFRAGWLLSPLSLSNPFSKIHGDDAEGLSVPECLSG